jgi:hypothetical protein
METCKSCKFFEERAKQCRAAPPVVHLLQNDRWVTLFPETTRDGWCGYHESLEKAHRFELGSPLMLQKDKSNG